MVAKLGVAADSSDYFKVKEINALLQSKGVKPRGKNAQKCKQLALACTADEVQAFRAEKEAGALAAAKKQKRAPGQLSMEETVKRMRARCTHDFVREFPSGPRDRFGTDLQPSLEKTYYHHLRTASYYDDYSDSKVELGSPTLKRVRSGWKSILALPSQRAPPWPACSASRHHASSSRTRSRSGNRHTWCWATTKQRLRSRPLHPRRR